jgi:hypothetical protein
MVSTQFISVLRKVHVQLSKTDVNWAVVGSLGLALRGLPLEPHDIDIMTDKSGAYEIERIFSRFVTKRVALRIGENIQSHYGALEIDGVKIEIMGEFRLRRQDGGWDEAPDLPMLRRLVKIEDIDVPVLALEWEHHSYSALGRVERARAIAEVQRGGH